MDDRKKIKRKLFNIFEKDKTCNSLNEIPHSDLKTPKFNLKLTARRRSTRLKSEIFVERILPDSPENDPYAITKNDFEDTRLVYTPPKKKAKISKSPSFMERIDRYFNIQPSKASNTLSANSCRTTLDATEEAEPKIDKTVHSKASNSPKLKEDDDLEEYSFIDSIDTNAIVDMLNNTEIVDSQSQVKNEISKDIATPKKYDRKANENLSPIVRLNSKERKVSTKENNNLEKRKTKSNTSKKNQNIVESPVDSIHTNAIIDSIDTNAIVDMINNTEIVESQSQVKNENSRNIAIPKKYGRKSNENRNPIVRFNSKERKVSSKENNNLEKRKAKSNTSKKNQNVVESPVDSTHTNAIIDMVNDSETVEEKSQVQNEISNYNTTPKKYHTSKERDTKPKENFKTLETTERKVSCKENKSLQATINRTKTTKKNQSDEDYSHSPQPLRTRGRKAKFRACQLESDDFVGSKNNNPLNITNIFNTQKKLQESLITETSASLTSSPAKSVENKISVSLRKRERRQTISSIQMDNNITKANSSQQPSASLTSSPQETIENERSVVSLRKRSKRQTISGIQMDNNVAEVTKTNNCSLLPPTSLTSSPHKTVENELSVFSKKKGRRQTISGIQMDNNVAEVKENHDSCEFPAASLISSPQKSVENGRSVSLPKRGRRPTISGIKMDNNVAEVTETNDSSLSHSASLTLSPQKTVKNEISVPIRKRGRRPTISGIKMDKNVAEATETNESSQFPAASLNSNPQKSVENEISVPIRKRGRRPTISGIKMDNNVAEAAETNDSSQLHSASLTLSPQKTVKNVISVPIRKRGRRQTICGTQMDNNVAEVTEANDSSQLPSASMTSSPQKTGGNERSVSLRRRGRRPTISGIEMDNNVDEVTETGDSSQLPLASMTSSPQKTVKNEISVPIRKRGRRQTICGTQMDNNVAEVTEANDSSQLPSASMTSSPQKTGGNERSVSLRRRGRRPTISGIEMDNNVDEVTETGDSSQLPLTSMTSSPQKTVKNEISVPIRKRGRRQTICGTQMDNNVAEVTEANDSSQLPSASMASSPQKTGGNERSASLRRRGRRPTISGIEMDNNVDEVTETNDSSQLHSASLTSSPQKTVENERSVSLWKRDRRQTICGTQMDNNVDEVTETGDSSQLPLASMTSSPQKTVKNEISVPIRKRGRRPTISGIKMDNNVAEAAEGNDSSQFPAASLISSPQKSVENEISVPIRKRDRRQTICGIQMDNNIAEVIQTNDSSQLPRKRGRRPTICQTKLENYFTREANKTDELSMENQTEINSDKNVTNRITKNLNEKCFSKLNDNINSMTNNASDEQNTHSLPGNHKEELPTGSQQVKNQSIKQQKIRSADPNHNKVVEDPKRKRGRPRLAPNVAAEKQVKMRIQKINVAKKPKNTYGRLSKDKLNSANVRRIPKDRLDEALDMLQNEDHEIWKDRNISCNAGIHRYWETRTMTSDQNMKMKYARQFLLRRDWLNLSKILCLSNQDSKNNIYYPLLVKYATLCLAHTDKEQFHKFVNSLITMADSSAIIKKCTKISRQNEE